MSATPQEGARTVSGLTGPTEAVGETESETREFDIGAIFPPLGTHVLRTRYVDLAPGGTVRIHSHVHRPSFYLVVEGELEVHRSDRLQGERLRAGDTTQAVEGAEHWWRNPTGSPARLFVADLRPKAGHASGPDGARVREDAAAHAGAHPDPAGLRDPLPDLPQASLAGFSGPAQDIDEINILIAEVPLAAKFPDKKGINGLWMRARWLDIGPHGVVPLHDHRHRPNFMRVMHGTLTFHGPAGRQHYPAGSVVLEAGPEPHWWENRGEETVRLYAIDVYDRSADD